MRKKNQLAKVQNIFDERGNSEPFRLIYGDRAACVEELAVALGLANESLLISIGQHSRIGVEVPGGRQGEPIRAGRRRLVQEPTEHVRGSVECVRAHGPLEREARTCLHQLAK